MIEKKTWEEFKECKMLWWVNRTMAIFGWAIVLTVDDDTGMVINAFPARVKYRGFSLDVEEDGFKILTQYLHKEAKKLLDEQ